jgi:hypothetical protein
MGVRGNAREELRERAAELDVRGRPEMPEEEPAEAIARRQG